MKFVFRTILLILLFIALWTAVWLYYYQLFQSDLTGKHLIFDTAEETFGIQVEPWRVRSLQEISENDRVEFAKLYDDNRRLFGYGKEDTEPLKTDTLPFKFPRKSMIKKALLNYVTHSDALRKVGNMKKLILAADHIKQISNITSLEFKMILQAMGGRMKDIPVIESYNDKFLLTKKERNTLEYALPYLRKDAKRNRKNRMKRTDLHDFVTDGKHKKHKYRTRTLFGFYSHISRDDMYRESRDVDRALGDLSKLPVVSYEVPNKDHTLRPRLELSGHIRVWLTFGKHTRTQQTLPNHNPKDEDYRHTAEIAAYHLDRILGFRRALPCIGRIFNITKDLSNIRHQTHTKPYEWHGKICFKANTKTFYDRVCGFPGMIEGSIVPDVSHYNTTVWYYPWRQSDDPNEKAAWQTDRTFCDDIRLIPPYDNGRRLLDVVDLAILDFLQGNVKRTEYQTFSQFGDDTFIHHINNSHGFGKSYRDEISILAPLYQCCTVRFSTFQTLLNFGLGSTRLSQVMSVSLSHDPLAPVLLDQHLLALDRRLHIILKMVYECINRNGATTVITLDGL